MSERSKARYALLDLERVLQVDEQFGNAENYIMDTQFEDSGPDNYVRVGELRALHAQVDAVRKRVTKLYEEFR